MYLTCFTQVQPPGSPAHRHRRARGPDLNSTPSQFLFSVRCVIHFVRRKYSGRLAVSKLGPRFVHPFAFSLFSPLPNPLAPKLSSAPLFDLGPQFPAANYPSYIALKSNTAGFVLKEFSVPFFLPILDRAFSERSIRSDVEKQPRSRD